jgi:hypothetical protein
MTSAAEYNSLLVFISEVGEECYPVGKGCCSTCLPAVAQATSTAGRHRVYVRPTRMLFDVHRVYVRPTRMLFDVHRVYVRPTRMLFDVHRVYVRPTRMLFDVHRVYVRPTRMLFDVHRAYVRPTRMYYHLQRKNSFGMGLSSLRVTKNQCACESECVESLTLIFFFTLAPTLTLT